MRREELIERLAGKPRLRAAKPADDGPSAGRTPRAARAGAARSRPRGRRAEAAGGDEAAAGADKSDTETRPTPTRWSWSRRRSSTEAEEPVEIGPVETEEARSPDDGPTEEVRGVLELTRQRYGFLRLAGLAPDRRRRLRLRRPGPPLRAAHRRRGRRARRASRAAASATAPSSTSTRVNGEEPPDRAAARVRRPARRSRPSAGSRSTTTRRRARARRRPAGAARLRPAGPGPRRGALGPDDPAALARPGRRRPDTAR